MKNHFRMCASAYRDGAMIDASVYAGLPDKCHDGKITRIDLDDPKLLKIYIEFTREAGKCPDKLVWTWESRCLIPYGGQEDVELIGRFEGKPFSASFSLPDSKPGYEACPFIVIARNIAHTPRIGCRSVLAGTDDYPEDYEQVYPDRVVYPDSKASKAECEEWRRNNCT